MCNLKLDKKVWAKGIKEAKESLTKFVDGIKVTPRMQEIIEEVADEYASREFFILLAIMNKGQ